MGSRRNSGWSLYGLYNAGVAGTQNRRPRLLGTLQLQDLGPGTWWPREDNYRSCIAFALHLELILSSFFA